MINEINALYTGGVKINYWNKYEYYMYIPLISTYLYNIHGPV